MYFVLFNAQLFCLRVIFIKKYSLSVLDTKEMSQDNITLNLKKKLLLIQNHMLK